MCVQPQICLPPCKPHTNPSPASAIPKMWDANTIPKWLFHAARGKRMTHICCCQPCKNHTMQIKNKSLKMQENVLTIPWRIGIMTLWSLKVKV